jgi:hypothetical protein
LELAFIELLPDKPFDLPPTTTTPAATAAPAATRSADANPPEANGPHGPPRPVVSQQKPAGTAPESSRVVGVASAAENNAFTTSGDTSGDGRKPAQKVKEGDRPAAGDKPKPAEPALTLSDVSKLWRDMVVRVGQRHKNLPPLLGMCRPLAVEGNRIILGFDYPIFKDKFDKMDGAAHAVTEAYRELTGVHCAIRLVVTSEYTVPIAREEFDALAEELGGIVRDEG